jgi:glycosyltransferase involved in cell wall biosynthesis
MSKRIHIKIADRGWILERCAREIAERSPNVTFGTDPDASADLQYYINYSARSRRVSSTEIAFFTHSERDPNARQRYFDAARDVDHCVCMSARYAQELIEAGIPVDKVTTIAPGVDLDEFRPKVRIGVVGRTYHTGRKGEALVAEVMDVPGIEWRFTGSGWPGPSIHVPDGRMADFYNDLDYVLVPALYEGGPMSVLEGLACGVPIISSDVGWAPDYPHIPFENGNAQSLREVLERLVVEREELRAAVKDRTWDAWAEAHVQLFDKLLGESAETASAKSAEFQARMRVTLVTHGTESKSIGGPSVRVPRTAAELAGLGIAASLPREHADNFGESQLAHVFNVWPADSCFHAIDRARSAGKRVVLSPIFLNLANIRFAATTFPRIFSEGNSDKQIESALADVAREIAAEPNLPIREPFKGFHARVRACIAQADEVIFLSEYERGCLEYLGAEPRSSSLIRNPVDAGAFAAADPALFAEKLGLDGYVLCVGRIEPRKNQLLLAHAARTLGIPVVFIGHTEDSAYYDLVRERAGENAHFIPRIDPADPLLKSAFAGASAFCLPSWAEGAPLAALEAAAAGLPLVLSDRSSEREYFGDFAHYVNPADVSGLREALESAAEQRNDVARRDSLKQKIAQEFGWERYTRETASAYERALALPQPSQRPHPSGDKIFFDLTTSFHASGNPTGIARVEGRALQALLDSFEERVVPIVWNGRTQRFVQVSKSAARAGIRAEDLEQLEDSGDLKLLSDRDFSGGQIVVLGGAWIRNRQYIAALHALKGEVAANVTLLVHDLIQMKLKHLYPAGVGDEFEANARLMVGLSDRFLAYSEQSRRDLQDFLIQNGEFFKKISSFRLGDMTDLGAGAIEPDADGTSSLRAEFADRKFAIYVSTVEIRKNHALLVNVWRRLIEERGSAAPHLVFIGRSLWRGEEVVDSIRRDESLRRHIHVLEDVNDSDLHWFYENCAFTLYPSLYEGWGLPVAESLAYGKVCITSDRTATREIAPNLTDLLDPYDFRSWHDRIAFYFDNPAALERAEEKIRREYESQDWSKAVGEIISSIDSAPYADPQAQMLYAGETIEFFADGRSETAMAVSLGGWGNIEKGGRWSLGKRSTLAFRYPSQGSEFHIRLRLRALARPHKVRRVRIVINRRHEEMVDLPGTETEIDLTIPARKATDSIFPINRIEIEPLELLSPSMINGGPDRRLLGVQLIAAQVADNISDFTPFASATLVAPAGAQSVAAHAGQPHELLKQASDLVTLPPRFTGKRPMARLARAVGFDRIWLRLHARKFRRTYASIGLIIEYLRQEKRA